MGCKFLSWFLLHYTLVANVLWASRVIYSSWSSHWAGQSWVSLFTKISKTSWVGVTGPSGRWFSPADVPCVQWLICTDVNICTFCKKHFPRNKFDHKLRTCSRSWIIDLHLFKQAFFFFETGQCCNHARRLAKQPPSALHTILITWGWILRVV